MFHVMNRLGIGFRGTSAAVGSPSAGPAYAGVISPATTAIDPISPTFVARHAVRAVLLVLLTFPPVAWTVVCEET
ncbi:hypothetical protein GCM10010344_05060 [Streptomyces bluensis]|nr:hypothetical protein GCM10010344_05060 [Streptomyces bluensis]